MIKYTVSEDQSLFDIALQVYGDVSGYRQLLHDNPELTGADANLAANQLLLLDESKVLEPELVAIYSATSYRVNSGIEGNPALPPPTEEPAPGGGSDEPVLIKDSLGNLITTVLPGGTYVVPAITSIEGGDLAAGDEQYTPANGQIIGEPL